MSLAERLNLHAPFRSFGDGNGFKDLDSSRLDHARKRRRSPSSASSLLEPAAFPVELVTDKVDRKVFSKRKSGDRHDDNSSQTTSEHSQSSNDTSSPQKPAKTYERRPRYKTKEDRYELKQSTVLAQRKKTKKDKKEAEAKKYKKSKVHRKSGAALVHDFAAQNVAQDRLTVRSLSNGGSVPTL